MKKIIALLLSLIMICSLATVAFADEPETPAELTDMNEVIIQKNYLNTNGQVSPAETFYFTISKVGVTNAGVVNTETGAVENFDTMPVPTVDPVTYEEGDAGKVLVAPPNVDYVCIKNIVVKLPAYKAVGIYTYKIMETAGTMAGVTYHPDPIKLVVTVIEQGGKVRVAAVHTENEGAEKDNMITNVYDAGELAVKKTVTGNLGDLEKEFTVTVKFKAPEGKTVGAPITYTDGTEDKTIETTAWSNGVATAEIILKHDETVTFKNIPYGVKYAIVEDSYAADGYDAARYVYGNLSDPEGSNTINFDPFNSKITMTNLDNIVDDAADDVEIINNKEAEVDTGIALDSAPYFLMLAVAVIGMVALVSKKRYEV